MKTSPPPITSSRWGARTKRIVVIVTLLLLVFLAWNLLDILPLIIVSMLLSYLLWPLVNMFDQKMLFWLPFDARGFAVLFAFLTAIGIVIVALIVILPVIFDQIAEIGRRIPGFLEAAEAEVERVLNQPIIISGQPMLLEGEPVIPLERIQSITGMGEEFNLIDGENFDLVQALSTFLGSLGGLTGSAFNVLGGALNVVFNITFLVIIMFYMMRDGDKFTGYLVQITPTPYEGDVRRLLYELGSIWNAYLRGQLILCIIVGMAVYVAALLLGLPNAPILGLIAGLLEFIPNIGPFLALVPAAGIALATESSTLPFLSGISFALTVIMVWTFIQQLEALLLVPRIMGGSLNLHPLVVILAVIAGASLAGAIGVVLAAPFAATGRLFGQYFYGKLFDVPPFPERRRAEVRRGPWLRTYHVLRRVNPVQRVRNMLPNGGVNKRVKQ